MADSFETLYRREYPAMVALAAAVSGRRGDAEDLAQDAFSRLHSRWAGIAAYDRPGAWLRRVTINLALSRRRRLASEARALLRLRRHEPTMGAAPPDDQPIWAAVAALSGRQRAVIALRYLEDRTTAEMAEILDIAEPTVRVHLHRALNALRDALEPAGEDAR